MATVKIFPSLTDKVFPGCGFDSIRQKPTSSSPFSSPKHENSNNEIVSIPDILFSIKTRNLNNLQNKFSFVCDSIFKESTQNFMESNYFVSLSDLYNFLDLNGMCALNTIKSITSPLNKVVFDNDSHSLFIKRETVLLNWSFIEEENNFSPLVSNFEDFTIVHGDSFIKEISFGRESVFQLDFLKADFDSKNIDPSQLKMAIDNLFGSPEKSSSYSEILAQINDENCQITALKISPHFKDCKWSFNELINYMAEHEINAWNRPSITSAFSAFYDDENLLQNSLLGAYQPFFENLTYHFVPNCIDLFQSTDFLKHILNYPTQYSQYNSNAVLGTLEQINRDLKQASDWVENLKKDFVVHHDKAPAIHLAEDLLAIFLTTKVDTENEVPLVRLSQSEEKLSEPRLLTKEEEKVKLIEVGYHNLIDLSINLLYWMYHCVPKALRNDDFKHFVFASNEDRVVPSLFDINKFGYGIGYMVWKIPNDLDSVIELLNYHRDQHKTHPKQIYILELKKGNDIQYTLRNAEPKCKNIQDLCSSGPRSISVFEDGKRHFFHLCGNDSLLETPGFMTPKLLEIIEKFKTFKSIVDCRDNIKEEVKTKGNQIEEILNILPTQESVPWCNALIENENLREFMHLEIMSEKNKNKKEMTQKMNRLDKLLIDLETDLDFVKKDTLSHEIQEMMKEITDQDLVFSRIELSAKGYRNEAEEVKVKFLACLNLTFYEGEDQIITVRR